LNVSSVAIYFASNSVFITHFWFAIAHYSKSFSTGPHSTRRDPLLWCYFAQRNGRNITKLLCGELGTILNACLVQESRSLTWS
jgi:hypothetical protein